MGLSGEGLVRIGLKKAFADGTVAVDLDPLSLLSRLAASPALPYGALRGRARLGEQAHRQAPGSTSMTGEGRPPCRVA